MPNVVESFLKVNAVVEEVTLWLHVFFNDDYAVANLSYCAPAISESSLRLGQQFHCLTFQSIMHDFAGMSD
ncbi:hypothetical protein DPMN_164003 [Dreissena polymorpha]|uniref:Uncharacterized protein n=1 Tax=Dreissena polymorpha TaxID=45954 RepID=A0A9D4ETB0_DREPO|nr:hypothetical protein DPMN_164003 [Dreissena polymorpha]